MLSNMLSNMMKMFTKKTGSIPASLSAYLWGAIGNDFSELKQLFLRQAVEEAHNVGVVDELIKHDVNVAFMDELVEELLRYLFLLTDFSENDEIQISPSETVDKALHCLLLDPILYYRVCDKLLSLAGFDSSERPIRVLPHNPLGGDDADARLQRLQNTLDKYARVFKNDPLDHIWNEDDDEEDGAVVSSAQNEKKPLVHEVPKVFKQVQELPKVFKPTPHGEPSFEIVILNYAGKRFEVTVGSVTETVYNLMLRIQMHGGMPPDQQRLIISGRQLEEDRLLTEYEAIVPGATVHMVLRLRGC